MRVLRYGAVDATASPDIARLPRRSWGTVKPPSGAQIDWGHPLAQGLVFATLLNPGDPTESVTGRYGTGAPTWGPSGLRPSSQLLSFVPTPVAGNHAPAAGYTVMAAGATTSSAAQLIFARDSASFRHWTFGYTGAATGMRFQSLNFVTGYPAADTGTTRYRDGNPHQWVGVLKPGSPVMIYEDGIAGTSADALSAATEYASTEPITLGGRSYGGSNLYWSGDIYYAHIWHRPLTRDEIRWLAAEPYAFIKPPDPQVLYFPMGSADGAAVALTGSGANASAGTGSLTVTPSFVHQLSGSGANASGGSAALSLGIALSGYGAAASGGILVTLTDTTTEPTGGYAPHRPPFRPPLPTRPLRISRRRRYIASKSCTFGIRAVRYRHARPGTRTHTAHITHRATRPATTSRAHAAGMTGSSTRTALRDTEMRCDLYRPHSPERVAARLAELYAELL